jgi:uncharacterized protein with PIN domain
MPDFMYPRCSKCNGLIIVIAGKLISGRTLLDSETKEKTYICEACYERQISNQARQSTIS